MVYAARDRHSSNNRSGVNGMAEHAWLQRLQNFFQEDKGRAYRFHDGFLRAAVLIPLVVTERGVELVFQVRAQELRRHSGEICFPGGRLEATDADSWAGAVRETMEEMGLASSDISYLGEMDMVISVIGAAIFPVIGQIHSLERLSLSAEVAEVFTVPLADLLSMEPIIGHMEMATRPLDDFPRHVLPADYPDAWKQRRIVPVFFYRWQERVIWGLTAAVLQQFLVLCQAAIKK